MRCLMTLKVAARGERGRGYDDARPRIIYGAEYVVKARESESAASPTLFSRVCAALGGYICRGGLIGSDAGKIRDYRVEIVGFVKWLMKRCRFECRRVLNSRGMSFVENGSGYINVAFV